jgi:hypothetical protein
MENVNSESYGELLLKNFIAFVQGTACNRDGMFSTKLESCRVSQYGSGHTKHPLPMCSNSEQLAWLL